ncbi:flagellar biosynthesis protein FlhF [Jeotgalibacillus haloalkalitolerans]|uniref:Flagellar biosynthesis protein FlhF n=1 Tax=Jeotgalibacillus haloalkalitolerans TaxID=3104292 RepID=A0ABU5KKH4_9BACL|nr:flagellar biosynthesis protein FlhF [Jeotgalibacillus sp. HH7-29]MDZ5711738.1 flagellar biosynthesis protein FlhF [Jeotgalibacillus sp. HH7-29]
MKKITAPTMPEAMKKVRKELGSDAVILNSKVTYTGGFLGLFKTKQIEVVAGVDSADPVEQMSAAAIEKPLFKAPDVKGDLKLENEIKELKQMVHALSVNQSGYQDFPVSIRTMLKNLHEQDFKESWVLETGRMLHAKWENQSDKHDIPTWTKEHIQSSLKQLAHEGIDASKKYISLIGPTGVGKTTTIAKLAAKLVMEDKKKIGFITSDTYRIGAIEQLRTYAELLDVPVEVIYNREDFKTAADRFRDYDHVLIDTAGRNYREVQYVEDLMNTIDFNVEMQTFLVLSMTSKFKEMKAIFDRFNDMQIDGLIFTKCDESITVGPAFHMMVESKIGTAYLTNGQAVPEDIQEGSLKQVNDMIVKGVKS